MQQATAPSNGDPDDGNRKAKLRALLDRARVNRGLQPELSDDAAIGHLENVDESMDVKPPRIKTEPTELPAYLPANGANEPHKATPKCTCSHNHQSSTASSNSSSPVHNEPQALAVQTDGEREGSSSSSSATPRVAVLSSAPKPRIADLTGGSRDRVPKLQQLKPLEMPRNNTLPQPQPEEKNHAVKRENLPPRAQPNQPRKTTPPPTNPTASYKKLELLTPDEYEDSSELHGDFQHMLHILIPSNAITALLERRGQPIRTISHQSDCTLSIREPEASPFKDDRLLRIYGKAKCISLAQRLVIAYIRAYRAEKGDPNYMDLSEEAPPVALPATSITKAMSVAVSSGKKNELEITNPFIWMVQREEVGKMMGRQGNILAGIRRDTGTTIHVDEDVIPGTTERRVVLGGSVEGIAAAIEEIKMRAGGRPVVSASVAGGRLGQYFAIPYHATGCLIGPQGATVKSITERTGARLQIPSAEDLPLGSINRILHMQGTPKQAEHALRVVGAKLRDYLTSSKCPRTVTPSSTGRKGDKVTIKVLMPSRICGFMLDNRGKLIREISEKSGAYAHLLAPHDDENRVCVFTGEMSCVLRAQRLVLQVVAGDAISSKRVIPPRKRKRSQRDEEEEEEYAEVAEENDYMGDEEPYYDDDAEESYYEDDYEEVPRMPVKRQTIRRLPAHRRRPRQDYEEDGDQYTYHNGLDEIEYEERPHQPVRRRPVATRPREYIEDEYVVDEYAHNGYDHNDQRSYEMSRPRLAKRPAAVRHQPLRRRREEYDNEYEEYGDEYDDEYAYADDGSDDEYEQPILARDQMVKRRAIGSRQDSRRPRPVVLPGRKVQMVVPKSSPREARSRASPTERRRTNGSISIRPSSRGGSASSRHSAPRGGGRGNGRPSSTSRDRGNGNKRRRQ